MAHYLFPEKRTPSWQRCTQQSRSLELELARSVYATARALHRAVAFGRHSLAAAAAPPVAIHFHYVRARACARARARVFNYIFASQLPGERTGRGNAGKKKRRGRARTIQPEKSCRGRDEEESARSNFITWKSPRSTARRSIVRFFYHPSAACGFA